MGYETWTDPLVSWIGAAGVGAYLVYTHRRRTRSGLEGKVLFLLYCLAALFFIRGFYWATDDVRLQVPAFVPATLLPLAITLFVEALMRRHVSPALKLFVAVGTVVFFALNLTNILSREDLFTGYQVFALGTFAWLGLALLTRDRRSHSPMENRLIDGTTAALAFTLVVALTDLQIRPDWLHFRVGSIGGLIFVYVCLRWIGPGDSSAPLLGGLLRMGIMAVPATLALVLLVGEADPDLYGAVFVVTFSLVLLGSILGDLRTMRILNERSSFFQWLARSPTRSLEEFVDSLDQLALAEDHRVLRSWELEDYEPEVMARAFREDDPVETLSALRSELARGQRDPDAVEQLIDLLERYETTHVTLLSADPPVFLLLSLPELVGAHDPMLHVALLQKFGRLLSSAVSPPRRAALGALLVATLLGSGCAWPGRLLRGYADGESENLTELLAADEPLAGDPVTRGMVHFVFDDMGALNTDGLESYTLPWKVVAAGLVLRAHDVDGRPVHPRTLSNLLTDMGFIFPSTIRNWEGPPPALDGPIGLLRADLKRGFPRVELEAGGLGCATCHAGVLYDERGAPTEDVWLGLPNTSIDLERYVVSVFEGLRHFQGREERLWSTMERLFPGMTEGEKDTIRDHVLPGIRTRFAGEWQERSRPVPFVNGSPGVTNGVASLKNILGMLDDEEGATEVGFTSIPFVAGRGIRSSLLYDGVYAVPGRPRFEARERSGVTAGHLDEIADLVTFFVVPTLGVPPRRVREAYPAVREVVEYLETVAPPAFPGPLDSALALEGEAVYRQRCASCHGTHGEQADGTGRRRLERFPNRLVPQDRMGTDPRRWQAATEGFARRVAESEYGRYLHAENTGGYVAPPLTAIWASAPYLHNGSVPTLWHLMHPEERPERFMVGGHALDFERVGIAGGVDGTGLFAYPSGYRAWSEPVVYDTSLPGRGRAGHEAEFEGLTEARKSALLEYLKLL